MFKVRFHLGAGENFMKWQIKNTATREKIYLDPKGVNLEIINGRLVNEPATAKSIFDGAHKTVCAWVLCDDVKSTKYNIEDIPVAVRELFYNPKIAPFWRDRDGNNVDGENYQELYTVGNHLYVNKI